jgi:putative membrane protein
MKSKLTVSRVGVLIITAASLTLAGLAMGRSPWAHPTHTVTLGGTASSLSPKDKAFMKKAARGGMMEVAMGKLADQNGQSEDVKSFGKRMVTDHSKANEELKSIAEKKGVKLPSKGPSATWGSDKAYMNMMVKDHEKDLAEFQDEATNGSDPDVKKFAEDSAKVVQEHLDLAKQTQSKLQ